LLALICFFLSGAAGLVLEEVWTRELTLVFGSTTLALSTVLSVFMGGLALGSRVGGRYADRLKRPLVAYALAEAGVGLYALALPWVISTYPRLNAGLFTLFGERELLLSLGRFLAAALLLFLPTTLMGATLPILSRHATLLADGAGRIGRAVGTLYAVNTFGAVVGAFLGGFVLLPRLGVTATSHAAALTDLGLAALVLLAAARRRAATPTADHAVSLEAAPPVEEGPAPDAARPDATPRERRLVLVAFGISGAVAMVYQVLWTRALAIVIGSSVYGFTLILLAFLVGLAVGAAITARLVERARSPVAWLGAVHLATAAAIAFSYLVIDELPAAFLALLRGNTLSVDGILFCQFLLAAIAILPATLLMGAVLPLTMRVVARARDVVGHDVGVAYSVNTLGAIVGSFAAGFIVLPSLGLQRGLGLFAILTVLLGATLILFAGGRPSPRRLAVAIAAPAIAAAAIAVLPRWSLVHFSAGLFRVSIAKDIIESQRWATPTLEFYKDGIATTVSVERWNKTVALKNNGKVDASNGDDMATQIMVGLMPLVVHPTALDKPPRVAVIGFGSGVTVGAVTQFPIAHADVVELEPAVVEAGVRWFGEYNHHPERNDKVRIIVGDGRNFLSQRPNEPKYDVIVSEPSNPWITGVSNLFTVDYWKLARARLADDGVFCQWAQLYEMTPPNIKTILRSFAEVFPYTYVFAAEDLSSDVIMVAANHPLGLDLERLQRNFAHPLLAAELKRGGVHSAEDIVAQLLLVPRELPAFTAGALLNTDDNARIEFAAPRDLLGSTRVSDPYLTRVYAAEWPYGRFDRDLKLPSGDARWQTELRLAEALLRHGRRLRAEHFVARARRHGAPAGSDVERLVSSFGVRSSEDPEIALTPSPPADDPIGLGGLEPPRLPEGASEADAAKVAKDYLAVERAVRAHAWAHALVALRGWPEKWVDDAGPDLALLLGYVLYKADLPDEAVDKLRPLMDDAAFVARRPALRYYLARAQYGAALFDAAVRNMKAFLGMPASRN
jgi:spermidine synthase